MKLITWGKTALLRGIVAAALALVLFAAVPALMAQDRPPWARNGSDQPSGQAAPPQEQGVPAKLNVAVGTLVSVRTTNWLSTDHSKPGETFTAVLEQPLIIDGWVVAKRGQTVLGQVTVSDKGGRVKGTSQLGVELTELTLVDGQQLPLHTQLLKMSAGTSHGQDAGAVAGTTALGAAIGAAADWGRGAAIGAGAGAAAGILGVLVTRGKPTVIPAESVLTFRTEDAVSIPTERSQFAFRQVSDADYGRGRNPRPGPAYGRPYPPYCSYCGPYPYYYPSYYYPGYFYPGPVFVGVFGFHSHRFRRW